MTRFADAVIASAVPIQSLGVVGTCVCLEVVSVDDDLIALVKAWGRAKRRGAALRSLDRERRRLAAVLVAVAIGKAASS